MSSANVRTGIDSWVSDAAPATNHGGARLLNVASGATVRNSFIYVKSPVPRGATVLSATLKLYGVGNWGGSATVDVQRVAASWKGSQINFDNQPGVTGAVVSRTLTETVDATEWAFDVTALLQLIADGAANYGFRISTTATVGHQFYSLNHDTHRPALVVEWSDAPDAPTEMSPSGGSAVTISKPVLLFNFHDVSGSTQMAACQVQINPTNSFGAPAFDSGTVTTIDAELDLATTAYAGLTVGSTAWWRVRVQDAAGIWSQWSDPVSFTRTARGALTIGSPTGGVVSDATPTVIWSLTGATQTGWAVTVWDDSDPGDPIYNTGRRSGTATSFTLPKHVVDDESTTYRLRVRVWDTPLRVTTPGDPVHTEAVETFVFVEDPTPNAPTSVTAGPVVSGQPHVKLDIVIPVAPDSFAIVRNGRFIDADVDPTDIYLSGTTYRFIDRTAAPHTDYVYKVRSKDGGVLGPARTATPNPFSYGVEAVWLLDWDDPGSSRLVPVLVELDQCTFDMPEIFTSHEPINGAAPVDVTQGQRGLAGQIVGRIIAHAGLSAAASVADMLYFKKHPQNDLRLTIGAQNLRVSISGVVLAPLNTRDANARAVRFDFRSLDGPTQQ